jgi:hypothetical protein
VTGRQPPLRASSIQVRPRAQTACEPLVRMVLLAGDVVLLAGDVVLLAPWISLPAPRGRRASVRWCSYVGQARRYARPWRVEEEEEEAMYQVGAADLCEESDVETRPGRQADGFASRAANPRPGRHRCRLTMRCAGASRHASGVATLSEVQACVVFPGEALVPTSCGPLYNAPGRSWRVLPSAALLLSVRAEEAENAHHWDDRFL